MTVKKCDVCGRPVVEGEYIKYGDKVICLNCPGQAGISEDVPKEELQSKITCPECLKSYDIQSRRCPYCKAYNPTYDFPFFEFIINVSIASMIISAILFFIGGIIKSPTYLLGILLSPLVIIQVFVNTIALVLLFYFGRWIRAAVFRR